MSIKSYQVASGHKVIFVGDGGDLHVHCDAGGVSYFDGKFKNLYMTGSATIAGNLRVENLHIGGLPPHLKGKTTCSAERTHNGQRVTMGNDSQMVYMTVNLKA